MSTYYKLELRTYCSSPVLNWDVMLKMTDIVLDLMTDIDMHQFIEKGMGDVVSYIEQRQSKDDNKYMKPFDKNKPSKYFIYLDSNNLHA